VRRLEGKMDVLKEIDILCKAAEYLNELELEEKTRKQIIEWIKENTVPYRDLYECGAGDYVNSLRFFIVYGDGTEEEVPHDYSWSSSGREQPVKRKDGIGLADFVIKRVAEGKKIKAIKAREIYRCDWDSARPATEEEYMAFFDAEVLKAAVTGFLQKFGEVKEVKEFGNSGHITLSKSLVGRKVLIIPL
jgi:putative transposon-encoded protein